jgi:hypothetical protein
MSWSYRLMAFSAGEIAWLAIHEVYYDADHTTLQGYIETPANVVGDDVDEVRLCLQRMIDCLAKPTLTEADFTPAIPSG